MQELKPGLLYCTEPPEKTWTIQVWTKPNPLWLYSESNEYIQGIRPEELWTEVFNIVQEAVIPKKKKCKNPKWLCDKASSGQGPRLALMGEPRGFSRVSAGFSSYDIEFRIPIVLAQGSPIFNSICEGELAIAL